MRLGRMARWILLASVMAALSAVVLGDLEHQDWAYDDEDYIRSARHAGADFLYLLNPHKEGLEFDYNAARPTVHLYFWLLYPLLGENPGAYHLANVVVHTLNALLLSILVFAWCDRFRLAGMTGLLFLMNLSYFRAVYWIAGIGILLGTLLGFGSVLAMMAYLRTRRPVYWTLSFFLFLFAPFAHESAIVFIGLLAILCARSEGTRRGLRLIAPHAAIILVTWAVSEFVYNTPLSRESDYRIGLHMARNLPGMVFNLFFHFFAGEYYDAEWYPVPVAGRIVAGMALLTGLLLIVRRVRPLAPVVVWLTFVLLPFLPFVDATFAWRYHYLPAAAASLLTAAGVLWVGGRAARKLRFHAGRSVLPLVLTAGLVGVAWPQVGLLMAIQHSFSGLYLSRNGSHERALAQYEWADAKGGGHPAAYHWQYNKALTLLTLDRVEDGYRILLRIVARYPLYERGRTVLLQAFARREGLEAPRTASDGSLLLPKWIVDRMKEEALAAARAGRREEAEALTTVYLHFFVPDREREEILRESRGGTI
ncbi:MAG: hypothetical protein ABIK65_13435 [Candidatus Eisenbacteria bacterium]